MTKCFPKASTAVLEMCQIYYYYSVTNMIYYSRSKRWSTRIVEYLYSQNILHLKTNAVYNTVLVDIFYIYWKNPKLISGLLRLENRLHIFWPTNIILTRFTVWINSLNILHPIILTKAHTVIVKWLHRPLFLKMFIPH